MATDTKITLIKKSGPGVLIGLVELTSKMDMLTLVGYNLNYQVNM
jgi:hypothetical protein